MAPTDEGHYQKWHPVFPITTLYATIYNSPASLQAHEVLCVSLCIYYGYILMNVSIFPSPLLKSIIFNSLMVLPSLQMLAYPFTMSSETYVPNFKFHLF